MDDAKFVSLERELRRLVEGYISTLLWRVNKRNIVITIMRRWQRSNFSNGARGGSRECPRNPVNNQRNETHEVNYYTE
jgi:hypothetical protein